MALGETDADRDRARNCIHRVRYAERDGARLAFYEHGSGEPAIVFINPIVYGLSTFEPILEQLCQEFRVITVDCRGAGRSAPLVRPYSTLQHMEDLRAIIEAAAAAPIVGVGISRGSNLLIQLAHAHRELVGKIMTVGTPMMGALPDGRPVFNPDYMALREDAYRRGAFEELVRLQARYVYSEPDTDELRRMAIERVCRLPIETILSFYDPDPGMDIAPLLESIAVPTLVAHGRRRPARHLRRERIHRVPHPGRAALSLRRQGAQPDVLGHGRILRCASQFHSHGTRGKNVSRIAGSVKQKPKAAAAGQASAERRLGRQS